MKTCISACDTPAISLFATLHEGKKEYGLFYKRVLNILLFIVTQIRNWIKEFMDNNIQYKGRNNTRNHEKVRKKVFVRYEVDFGFFFLLGSD